MNFYVNVHKRNISGGFIPNIFSARSSLPKICNFWAKACKVLVLLSSCVNSGHHCWSATLLSILLMLLTRNWSSSRNRSSSGGLSGIKYIKILCMIPFTRLGIQGYSVEFLKRHYTDIKFFIWKIKKINSFSINLIAQMTLSANHSDSKILSNLVLCGSYSPSMHGSHVAKFAYKYVYCNNTPCISLWCNSQDINIQ